MRMRAKAQRIDLVVAFIVDPCADQIIREDTAFGKEVMVILERPQRFVERRRRLVCAGQLLLRHLIDVAIERFSRIDAVSNAIEHRHDHCRPGQISVATRIGAAELEPLRFGIFRVHRNADCGGTISRRQREVHRRLKARHETAVGVRRGSGEGENGGCVPEQSTGRVQAQLA